MASPERPPAPTPEGSTARVADSGDQHDDAPRTITLNILSPSTPERVTFHSVPITMTVYGIKEKIQDAFDSSPAPELQRLIYQGRALLHGDVTLATLFGAAVRFPSPYLAVLL